MREIGYWSILIGGFFTILCILNTARHVDWNLRHWQGHAQFHVLLILLLLPVWSFFAWLSVATPEKHNIYLFFMDCYEAIVLYHFFQMMKEYLGGFYHAARLLKLNPPFRFCRCCCLVYPSEKLLKIFQVCVLQFCIMKPIISASTAVLENRGHYHHGEFDIASTFFWLTIAKLATIMTAMTGLLMFYRLCRNALASYNVVAKFAFIKVLIGLHIFQMFLFNFLVKMGAFASSEEESASTRSIKIQYLVIVIEMFLLSLLMRRIFPYNEKSRKATHEILQMEEAVFGETESVISIKKYDHPEDEVSLSAS